MIALLLLIVILYLILWSQYQENKALSKWIIGGCIFTLATSIIFTYTLSPILIPTFLGPISIVAVSLMILTVILSSIYNWGITKKIPGITFLIGLAIISSTFNYNDNHQFRHFSKPQETHSLLKLESSFQDWLDNRPDRRQFTNKPYPVYITTAQGGGIYAAYHAATTLTKLTEYFPSFPQHIFAISAVSGGSLGASAFSSLVKVSETSSIPLSQAARELFSSDLLSPLLTMGLFPDLIQRFAFFPIDDWDRARGLEIAFERAWDNLSISNSENPLQQSFYQHWNPKKNAPALLLNTTVVETGDRLVISPFKIRLLNNENIALDEPNLDLNISTAAGLSARFPYVTPVGWYRRSSDNERLRLADGGYFDNSGIPTALDIGRALQDIDGYGKNFEIIYISLIDQPSQNTINQFKGTASQLHYNDGVNEVFSPIRSLFNARGARSRSAVELSTFTINDGIDDPLKYKFRTLYLNKSNNGINLPLGWLLSDKSREFIDVQTPNPHDKPCDVEKFRKDHTRGMSIIDDNHNLCVITSIGNDLQYVLRPTFRR
jgi:hypothetical protein